MDVDKFATKRKFQLNAFIASHQKLSALQINKGYILYGDIQQVIIFINLIICDVGDLFICLESAISRNC